jgi:nitrite reductase (cytochrome c-552)
MWLRVLRLTLAAIALLATVSALPSPAAAQRSVETCYECHEPIQKLHTMGKHEKVACAQCHSGLEKHAEDPGAQTRPGTDMSWQGCGKCHEPQYESYLKTSYHRPARDEKSQLTNRAPNPFWDKLMMGHGFTKEHDLTRSHAWMVVDHLLVDRAYGGRFQPKKGWKYLTERAGKPAWDYVEDRFPETKEHKPFVPQSAAAANPVCFQCKSQDQILDWAYMGEPNVGAKWSRDSNVVEFAKTIQYGTNCFHCHDPHAAKPRVVRDAMLQAFSRPGEDTLWHKDPNRTPIEIVELGARGYTRKIGILGKYDSRILCGQCHVEYNCNPGFDPKTGDRITSADPRTNAFPYRDVFGMYDFYVNEIGFLDWRHPQTGALLWKGQHPESETFYSSAHGRSGVECDDCHTPKMKDPKSGVTYTSHFATTPKLQLKETCLRCHDEFTEEEAVYEIESVKAYIRGKLRKAEFWLFELVERIVVAKAAGVSDEALRGAQDQHLRAHILWEWWVAENSDGYHNPQMARESLTRSVDESQKGIKLLDDALAAQAKK